MEFALLAAGWVLLWIATTRLAKWFNTPRASKPTRPWPRWVQNLFCGCVFGIPFLFAGPHVYLIAVLVIGGLLGISDTDDRRRV